MNDYIEKSQVGDKSKPVLWRLHISQEMTKQVVEYAKHHEICEADVFRKALGDLLGKPKKATPRHLVRAERELARKTAKATSHAKKG